MALTLSQIWSLHLGEWTAMVSISDRCRVASSVVLLILYSGLVR